MNIFDRIKKILNKDKPNLLVKTKKIDKDKQELACEAELFSWLKEKNNDYVSIPVKSRR